MLDPTIYAPRATRDERYSLEAGHAAYAYGLSRVSLRPVPLDDPVSGNEN